MHTNAQTKLMAARAEAWVSEASRPKTACSGLAQSWARFVLSIELGVARADSKAPLLLRHAATPRDPGDELGMRHALQAAPAQRCHQADVRCGTRSSCHQWPYLRYVRAASSSSAPSAIHPATAASTFPHSASYLEFSLGRLVGQVAEVGHPPSYTAYRPGTNCPATSQRTGPGLPQPFARQHL